MDHLVGLRRLFAVGAACGLALVSVGVIASTAPFPAQLKIQFYASDRNGNPLPGGPGDAQAMCQLSSDHNLGPLPSGYSVTVVTANGYTHPTGCAVLDGSGTNQGYPVGITVVQVPFCPDGFGLIDGNPPMCSGDKVPHTCPAAGAQVPHPPGDQSFLPGGLDGTGQVQPNCNGGCEEVRNHTVGTGVDRVGIGDATSTGKACGANKAAGGSGNSDGKGLTPSTAPTAPDAPPSASNPDTPSPANCAAKGLGYGTVGSTGVCAPTGSSSTSTSTTETTSPSGSKAAEETSTTTTQNPNGSTTTTTTTYHSDGSSSTTTSTGPAGSGGSKGGGGAGAGGGDCTGTDCGDGSFGGTCTTTFTCDGDAVQCAIAKEQHQRDCLMFQPDTQGGVWKSGSDAMTKALNEEAIPTWSPAHSSQYTSSNFDWTATIDHTSTFAQSCPPDVTFPIAGQPVTISFSSFCAMVPLVANLFLAFTAVLCGSIIFKGAK